MTHPCIIYAIVTILLSWTDSMRIKYERGKVANINHAVSSGLAAGTGIAVVVWWVWYNHIPITWWLLLAVLLIGLAFIGLRVALYDPLLNLFRLWTGTNPTGRIDYESPTTSSYIDNHSRSMPFWLKRVMGVAGFAVMFLLYKVIFKV